MNANTMIQALFQAMKSKGIELPTDVNPNDPNAILNYLMKNGKVTQQQYDAAYQKYRSGNYPNMNNFLQNQNR